MLQQKILPKKKRQHCSILGGYVLFALNKRIQQSKKWKTAPREQQLLSILQAGKQTDISNTDQRLVDSVNRGGLWKIHSVVERIFYHC